MEFAQTSAENNGANWRELRHPQSPFATCLTVSDIAIHLVAMAQVYVYPIPGQGVMGEERTDR